MLAIDGLTCEDFPDDGGSKYLWNVGKRLPDYTALQPRRQPSSYSPPWEPQTLLTNLWYEGERFPISVSTPNIIADARHAWLYECAVMRKKFKLSSDGRELVARNSNEAMVALIVGSGRVCVWQESESGVRRSVLCWCRDLASVAVKMFSHLIYYMKTFCKSSTFNAICKYNAAINCIIVQYKKIHSRQLWRAILS
jgi:hypothetical protein